MGIILDFIQNLKSSVKIHLKPQRVPSLKGQYDCMMMLVVLKRLVHKVKWQAQFLIMQHISSLLVQYFGTNDNLGYYLNEVTVSKLEKER